MFERICEVDKASSDASGAASGQSSHGTSKDEIVSAPPEPLPKQLAHVVMYESGLCNLSLLRFKETESQFAKLAHENTWSKAFYQHIRIVCVLAQGDIAHAVDKLAPEMEKLITRRIGGRLISAEQYTKKRADELLLCQGSKTETDSRSISGKSSASSDSGSHSPKIPRLGSVFSVPFTGRAASGRDNCWIHPALQVPALEVLYLWNAFGQVSRELQLQYLGIVDSYLAFLCGPVDSDPQGHIRIEYRDASSASDPESASHEGCGSVSDRKDDGVVQINKTEPIPFE